MRDKHVTAKIYYTHVKYMYDMDGTPQYGETAIMGRYTAKRARGVIEKDIGHSVLIIGISQGYDKYKMDANEFVKNATVVEEN